jgi:shikimate dehydrogenase
MHNAALSALGLNWRYLAFEVSPADLPAVIAGAQAMHFIGLNLTLPHKILALELVDDLDASAREWGAVNTIRFEGSGPGAKWQPLSEPFAAPPVRLRSKGFNTDATGLARALREDLGLELAGCRVLQLGAGGAGRVAALKLAAEGTDTLYLVNRTRARAEALAAEVSEKFPAVRVVSGYPAEEVDLLLNATSLGLKPGDELPLDRAAFSLGKAACVYDMIYQPPETRLLALAREAGCRVANGLGMLLYQGAEAIELWSGKPAPVEVMRAALHKHVYDRSRTF